VFTESKNTVTLRMGICRYVAGILAVFALIAALVLRFLWENVLVDPAVPCMGDLRQSGRGVSFFIVQKAEEFSSNGDVVMLPHAGRSASDFNELAVLLSEKNFRVLLVQAPGIDGSHQSSYLLRSISMEDLADDVLSVLDEMRIQKAHLVGHSFGERLARMFASQNEDRVFSLMLIAPGGDTDVNREVKQSMKAAFMTWEDPGTRLKGIHDAFFAERNKVPSKWTQGWYPITAYLQGLALRSTDSSVWWHGGSHVPILILHAQEDKISPRATADALESTLGNRVTRIDIPDAGHALVAEKLDSVASSILNFLAEHRNRNKII